jgi:hypothetical protein
MNRLFPKQDIQHKFTFSPMGVCATSRRAFFELVHSFFRPCLHLHSVQPGWADDGQRQQIVWLHKQGIIVCHGAERAFEK